MSITRIRKRVAYFVDDKGSFIGSKGFSLTSKTFKYENKSYNINHEKATFILFKRWYWDIEVYIYNINNPDPYILQKTAEPLMDAEMYNIQLESNFAKQLNEMSKGKIKIDFKTIIIILIGIAILYLLFTNKLGKIF